MTALANRPIPEPTVVTTRCFAPDCNLTRKNADGELEEVPIKDIREDDLVMCADTSGKTVFQPVVIKEIHANFDGEICEFLLDDNRKILVTPNHGMMVDRKIVLADQV